MIWKCLDIRKYTNSEYLAAYQMLDDTKRARIERTRQRKDRLRSVAADALARRMPDWESRRTALNAEPMKEYF